MASIDRLHRQLGREIEKLREHIETISGESDLLGSTEVAEQTGILRNHLGYWVRKGKFPEPYARLKMGPLWRQAQVDAWLAKHGKIEKSGDQAGESEAAKTSEQ